MIRLLTTIDAQNLDLIGVLVSNINKNYSETEKEFWGEGVERTSVQKLQKEIAQNNVLVYFENENPMGLVVYKIFKEEAMFGMLSVNIDQHGKRIGSQLYSRMEEELRKLNISKVKLEILVPEAYKSEYKEYILSWYKRMGFKIYERVETEGLDYFPYQNLLIKSDFLRMQKNLT